MQVLVARLLVGMGMRIVSTTNTLPLYGKHLSSARACASVLGVFQDKDRCFRVRVVYSLGLPSAAANYSVLTG